MLMLAHAGTDKDRCCANIYNIGVPLALAFAVPMALSISSAIELRGDYHQMRSLRWRTVVEMQERQAL